MPELSRSVLDALFASLPDPLLVLHLEDPEDPRTLRCLAANPAAAQWLGAPLETLIAGRLDDLPPAARELLDPDALAAVARGATPAAAREITPRGGSGAAFSLRTFGLPDGCVGVLLGHAPGEDERRKAFLAKIIHHIPDVLFVKEAKTRRYVLWNRAVEEMTGMVEADVMGKLDGDIFPVESAREIEAFDDRVLAGTDTHEIPDEHIHTRHSGWRRFRTRKVPIPGPSGEPEYLLGIASDNTDRVQADEALVRSDADLRATQQRLLDTIRALSTPVLPIHDGILVVPLIGHMDDERSTQFLETLLTEIHRRSTHTVILDITGLPVVDKAIADRLVQAIRAAELLGSHCVLVGLSPTVASTLVQVDFGNVLTLRDLQAGVAYALSRSARKPGARPA